MSYNDNVMESWQSGNAPDSKSGEPSFPWRAGSNPVHSLEFLANYHVMNGSFFSFSLDKSSSLKLNLSKNILIG